VGEDEGLRGRLLSFFGRFSSLFSHFSHFSSFSSHFLLIFSSFYNKKYKTYFKINNILKMTKFIIILCLGLLAYASASLVFRASMSPNEKAMLSSISQEEYEALCLVDPEYCHTDCQNKAASEAVNDGLGDCIVFACGSYIWQACCPHAGVVPSNCNCNTNPPTCWCYGSAQ